MDYLELNKTAWNARTATHLSSKFYDVAGFLNGNSSLNPIEIEQVGDVAGKKMLHLQCHFGLDSLSWSRMGAKVTGVDLSSEAIDNAQKLAKTLALEARFVNDDVYHFGERNQTRFDIVYTSYGVLCWLPDMTRWAQVVARSLKDNGEFHLIEFHPFCDLLSGFSYFPKDEPDIEVEGTYTENCSGEKSTTVTWPHPLGEVIKALIGAGICIESFQEYPFSPYDCIPETEFVPGKGYRLLHQQQQAPLVYSIKGRKLVG